MKYNCAHRDSPSDPFRWGLGMFLLKQLTTELMIQDNREKLYERLLITMVCV
jgi:anti-sigma regulatory factor (Ser/Thr protein kinase)